MNDVKVNLLAFFVFLMV